MMARLTLLSDSDYWDRLYRALPHHQPEGPTRTTRVYLAREDGTPEVEGVAARNAKRWQLKARQGRQA